MKKGEMRLTAKSLKPSLWSQLAAMALKRKLPHRGYSAIEIVSIIKSYWHDPPSKVERKVLDDACARYGFTWDSVPHRQRNDGT